MKYLFLLAMLIVVVGCMKTAQDFQRTPSSKLCIDYLNAGPFDSNQEAMETALYNRNEDCSSYAALAAQDRAVNAAKAAVLMEQGQILMQQSQPSSIYAQ